MKNKWISLIVNSMFAGVAIAFAAILYLYASTFVDGNNMWLRIIPALCFCFGLYFIIVMGYKLFTGMVAGLADMKVKEYVFLPVCYLFNTVAIVIICALVLAINNGMSNAVITKAVAVTEGKLANNMGGAFVSSIFCGMMITFAVKAPAFAREKGLSATLCILFPVMLFVYMGFEHCIANNAYIALALFGKANINAGRLIAFMVVTALGNVVGGVTFPLLRKLIKKEPLQ